MIGSVAWLKKAREAVADAHRTVSTSMVVAVIALIVAAAAMVIGLVYGRKQI
jgi:hypothetical protein